MKLFFRQAFHIPTHPCILCSVLITHKYIHSYSIPTCTNLWMCTKGEWAEQVSTCTHNKKNKWRNNIRKQSSPVLNQPLRKSFYSITAELSRKLIFFHNSVTFLPHLRTYSNWQKMRRPINCDWRGANRVS